MSLDSAIEYALFFSADAVHLRRRERPAPDGTPSQDGAGQGDCLPWSFSGYGPAEPLAPDAAVQVLTPPSIVLTLRAGYVPQVHSSAQTATTATASPPGHP